MLKPSQSDGANQSFRDGMDKYRLWKETWSHAALVVRTKLLFVEDGDELKQCLTDFYTELVKDIELLGSMNVERDHSVFKYVLDKLQNESSCRAVQLKALVLAAQLEEAATSDEDSDSEMLDYVDPFVIGGSS